MSAAARSVAALRKFVRPRHVGGRCELCARDLAHEHPHLLNLATRALACSCEPCAMLFAMLASSVFPVAAIGEVYRKMGDVSKLGRSTAVMT